MIGPLHELVVYMSNATSLVYIEFLWRDRAANKFLYYIVVGSVIMLARPCGRRKMRSEPPFS